MFSDLTKQTKSSWFHVIVLALTPALSLDSGQLNVILLVYRMNRQPQALAGA
jgi:hypothetical protein